MVSWIRRFLAAGDLNDPDAASQYYASSVNFFDEGNRTPAQILRDERSYEKKWPERQTVMEGTPVVQFNESGSTCILRFTVRFEARDGKHFSRGKALTTIELIVEGWAPLITSIQRVVTEREKGELSVDQHSSTCIAPKGRTVDAGALPPSTSLSLMNLLCHLFSTKQLQAL